MGYCCSCYEDQSSEKQEITVMAKEKTLKKNQHSTEYFTQTLVNPSAESLQTQFLDSARHSIPSDEPLCFTWMYG